MGQLRNGQNIRGEKKENHHKRAMKNDFYDFYLLESHGQGGNRWTIMPLPWHNFRNIEFNRIKKRATSFNDDDDDVSKIKDFMK